MGDPTGRQPRGNSCSRTADKKYDASFTTVKEAPQPMLSTGPFVAIETSSSPGSVAAGTSLDDLAEHELPPGGDHGRLLVPALAALTEEAGWPLAQTAVVSVAIGPGPFTGLRVGVTTAKAIAWAAGCPVAAIPTATCLAAQAVAAGSPVGPVQVVFDAGRGELYAVTALPAGPPGTTDAAIRWHLQVSGLLKPKAWRDSLPRGAAVTGSGLALADPLLSELPAARPDLWIAAPADRQPTASTVARLGLAAAERNELVDAATVSPIYLRASYAEEKKA